MLDNNRANDSSIIAIVGPTATGKTELGIRVARAINGEIVSADSQAVYRGLDIGTAKPGLEQRSKVQFHLIDVCEPDHSFSVARFKQLACEALHGIAERKKCALLVGGTGLYVKALLEDYSLTKTPANLQIRAELNDLANRHGLKTLHEALALVDPVSAGRIHPNDKQRIGRALEVYLHTGIPISQQQALDAETRKPWPSVRFALTAAKEELAARIDRRVDAMIAAGLKQEVERLLNKGYSPELPALRSLGYKEMVAHLQGLMSLAEATDSIKQNTRRFAKRQLTWFRADPDITWLDIGEMSMEQAMEAITTRLLV